jgi:hypothetical protein
MGRGLASNRVMAKCRARDILEISNNLPPHLVVTMTPLDYMAPRTKWICILPNLEQVTFFVFGSMC